MCFRNLKLIVAALFLAGLVHLARGQTTDSTDILDWRRGFFPKEKPGELYQIKANGFYRFFATHLYMNQPYILDPNSGGVTRRNTLFIGDDSQLPNFLVNISGRPNKKVSWGFDLYAFQFLAGRINPAYNGQVPRADLPPVWNPLSGTRLGANMGLNLGLNLYGSYLTEYGTFNVRMGGIHWFSMSDLTLQGFTGYNRFMMYERNPWDPIGKQVGVRYNQMYELGGAYQDLRFGERAIQGVILEGLNLPGGWSFAGMYGKTEIAGGFMTIPNINYGGQIKKTFKNHDFLAFNTLNNTTWVDSLNTEEVGFNIFTLEGHTSWRELTLHAEVGIGTYRSPISDYPWGEAINVRLFSSKKLTKIPIELHYYRISPYVVNNNALFWNTSILEARAVDQPADEGVQSANVLIPFASSMVGIGQMTNNRTGVEINTDVEMGPVKWSIGYGVSSEITAFQEINDLTAIIPTRITFSHFVNQLTRSRFWRWTFPQNVGPYGRYDVVYRDAFQEVELTDYSVGGEANTIKFNQLELHGKYRTKLAYRNFFVFFLGRYNTAQPDLSIIPPFSEDAYIRQYNTEVELYYQIAKPVFINTYLGYERVLGNYATTLDNETFRPLNQTGYGWGVGMDINLSRNAGLFLRHRWFEFEDTSFRLDQFSGQESMVELKVFF